MIFSTPVYIAFDVLINFCLGTVTVRICASDNTAIADRYVSDLIIPLRETPLSKANQQKQREKTDDNGNQTGLEERQKLHGHSSLGKENMQ
jgi:hypothetical protein